MHMWTVFPVINVDIFSRQVASVRRHRRAPAGLRLQDLTLIRAIRYTSKVYLYRYEGGRVF